jgi:putative DNA primase/helicase
MRRRMNLIPLTFVPSKPDKDLSQVLLGELPGILAWSIQGCLAWQRKGLRPPQVVQQATDEYFADQDAVANWVAERCKIDPLGSMPSRRAYADWKAWATARGEEPGTEKRFSGELERHFMKKRTKTGVMFIGVSLLPSDTGVW